MRKLDSTTTERTKKEALYQLDRVLYGLSMTVYIHIHCIVNVYTFTIFFA